MQATGTGSEQRGAASPSPVKERGIPPRHRGAARPTGGCPPVPVRPGGPAPRRPPLPAPGRSLTNPGKASAEGASGAAPGPGLQPPLGVGEAGGQLPVEGGLTAPVPVPLRRGTNPTAGRCRAAGKGLSLSSHEGRTAPAPSRSPCREAGKEAGRAGLSPGRTTPLRSSPRRAAKRGSALLSGTEPGRVPFPNRARDPPLRPQVRFSGWEAAEPVHARGTAVRSGARQATGVSAEERGGSPAPRPAVPRRAGRAPGSAAGDTGQGAAPTPCPGSSDKASHESRAFAAPLVRLEQPEWVFPTHPRAGSRADFYLEGLGSVCLKMRQVSSPKLFFFFLSRRENVSLAGSDGAPLVRSDPLRFGQRSQAAACRHRGRAPSFRTDTRTGTGDTAPLSVLRLLLRSGCRAAP